MRSHASTGSARTVVKGNVMNEKSYTNIPVLVTGGCGFIGSHLVEKLVALGANVTILDNLSTGTLENIQAVRNSVKFINGSITDIDACNQATKNQKIIFHLAALISVAESVEHPTVCHQINVDGTFNMLEAARKAGVGRFVFSSSAAVYGNIEGLCSENSPCHPVSPYGFSKRIGELYCQQYAHVLGLETVILRYFNVFGDRQNPNSAYAGVVSKFNQYMSENKPITVFGNGKQTRDFVPVASVVNANIKLGMHEAIKPGDIYNVATGRSISILELIDRLRQQHPHFSGDIKFEPARSSEINDSRADCRKIARIAKEQEL